MEIILDRIKDILEHHLPGVLTKINTKFATADTTAYTVPLTLTNPGEYLIGLDENARYQSAIILYSFDVDPTVDSWGTEGEMTIPVMVECHMAADRADCLERMLGRYMWAIGTILRRCPNLKDGHDRNPIAETATLGVMKRGNSDHQGGTFYSFAGWPMRVTVNADKIDELYGISL